MQKTSLSKINLWNLHTLKLKDIFKGYRISFLTPQQPTSYTAEPDCSEFTALREYYARERGLSIGAIAIEREGVIWERMVKDGLIYGCRFVPY